MDLWHIVSLPVQVRGKIPFAYRKPGTPIGSIFVVVFVVQGKVSYDVRDVGHDLA